MRCNVYMRNDFSFISVLDQHTLSSFYLYSIVFFLRMLIPRRDISPDTSPFLFCHVSTYE